MKPEMSASVPFPQNQRVLQSMMDWAKQLIIDGLDLVLGPQLSLLLFRAVSHDAGALAAWVETNRRSGALLCLSTTWHGETVLRICVVNPSTNPDEVLAVLRTLQ